MVRIISDTSTLYSTTQAREAGFAVPPPVRDHRGQDLPGV